MSNWTQPHGFFSMMSDDSKARRARAPQRYPTNGSTRRTDSLHEQMSEPEVLPNAQRAS